MKPSVSVVEKRLLNPLFFAVAHLANSLEWSLYRRSKMQTSILSWYLLLQVASCRTRTPGSPRTIEFTHDASLRIHPDT